jgi:hypothetical protein
MPVREPSTASLPDHKKTFLKFGIFITLEGADRGNTKLPVHFF